MNTLDVIANIYRINPNIRAFTFAKYPKQTLIQDEKSVCTTDLNFINSALEVRKKLKLPFWDSLMLSFFDKKEVSKTLLIRALKHNKNSDIINTKNINEIYSLLNNNCEYNLSLNSQVQFIDGSIAHLFLLDFHVYHSENNLIIVSDILTILGLKGYILSSGESYHFISKSFNSVDSIIDLLAKTLLFSPIVDRAWVAHQLLERSCSVRVGQKHGIFPTVVKELE